jgi:diacylglycerol O-acyltransferase
MPRTLREQSGGSHGPLQRPSPRPAPVNERRSPEREAVTAVTPMGRPRSALDRVSSDDLMSLVGDSRAAPLQVGAVLVLGGAALDPMAVRCALEQRLSAVPRLRRRLTPVPPGCGRPLWVDHAAFDIDDHFCVHRAAEPLTHQQLLDLAAELVAAPLLRDRPLWSATFVPDVQSGQGALVVVFHHVLADGVAGLALLADLLAAGPAPADPFFPRPEPPRRVLIVDALLDRLGSMRRLPRALARLVAGVVELGPSLRSRAEPCSLIQQTGSTRCLRTVNADLQEVVDVAHRHGATVNDVLLTVVAGALRDLLAGRDEQLRCLVVSVPFSTGPRTGVPGLGNHSGVVPVRLPTVGPFLERLASAAVSTRAAKRHLPGASTAVLAPAFRLLDRLGIYQHFIDHQRLIHTFVSNVRGPAQTLELLGRPLVELIPLSLGSGNVTVAFTALSYRGRLVVTINADPLTCPDVDRLCQALADQLSALPAVGAAFRG